MTSAFSTTWSPGLIPATTSCMLAGKHCAGGDFKALERAVAERHKDPVTVVDVQNRSGRNGGSSLRLLAEEGCGGEHPNAQHPGILHFQTHLGGADGGVQRRQDVIDASL